MSAYYNDIDPYCCRVLRKNIRLGNLPEGTVDERDIRDVQASDLVGYRHIHLFAGIGGFPLGLGWANFPESISIITGGFPCQDISVAGRGAGIEGSRSGLWREMARLVCDVRPDVVIVENSPALLGRGLSKVLGDLAEGGYDAEWQVLSAESIGAPHLRERVFIVGYPMRVGCGRQGLQHDPGTIFSEGSQDVCAVADPKSNRWRPRGAECQRQQGQILPEWSSASLADANGVQWNGGRFAWNRWDELTDGSEDVPYPDRQSLAVGQVFGGYARQKLAAFKRSCGTGTGQWAIESSVGRLANGIPHRVEQLRGYGNSIVPQLAQIIALCILAAIRREEVSA